VETVPLLLAANAGCAAALAVAVAALAGVVRRPAFVSRAWLLVLVKLVTPPLIAVPVAWAAVESEPAVARTDEARASPPPTSEPLTAAEPVGFNPVARPDEPPPPEPLDLNPADVPAPVPDFTATTDPIPGPSPEPSAGVSPLRLVFLAWLAGAAGYCALVASRVWRFRRLLRSAAPAPADLLAVARAVANRLGLRRLPEVAFVDAAMSPVVWATIGRPRVLLPRRLWAALAADQREAVLAHELAHLVRGDHWVRRLELVVLGAYWWFPVAWLAVRQLRQAEEACCDARAVGAVPGRAAAYAAALVEATAHVSCPGWVPLASGGAARASHLKRRLTMILRPPAPPRRHWPAGLVFVVLAAAALPWAPTLADDPPPPPATDPVRPVEAETPDDPPSPRTDPLPRSARNRPTTPTLDPPPRELPAAREPGPTRETVERLKDEVELLAVQSQVRRAAVRIAKTALLRAEEKVPHTESLVKKGFAQAEDLRQARYDVEDARAQFEMREAELQEHELRIAQAKRRLDRVAAVRPTTVTPGTLRVNPGTRPVAPRLDPEPTVPTARPTPASKDRLKQLEAEEARLTAEQDALAARFLTLEKQLAELKVLENDLRERIKMLRDQRKALDPDRKDSGGPPRRR
jgi:beta-lactamase regulating signal transducer with metallopeptidase domain